MEEIFVTSDTHFGHTRILTIGHGRPWDEIQEMNEALIEKWNARVGRNDRVYHLGDFSFLPLQESVNILKRLNGQLHYIRGNHDKTMDSIHNQHPELFASYQNYKEIKVAGQSVVLFHFPLLEWHKCHRGSWHLHGHQHGNMDDSIVRPKPSEIPRLDMGVDCWNYAPASWDQITRRMEGREWQQISHH